MKIAITADPEIPVPPMYYGGIERIIDLLIKELVALGHDVTLFAHRDSKVSCTLIPYPATGQSKKAVIKNTWCITKNIISNKFDVVHSFGRLAYLTAILPFKVKKIMSYQREPTISQIKLALKLSSSNSLIFTGCSEYIASQIRPYAPSYPIFNFVDVTKYQFQESVSNDAPLIFLGRVENIKGAHLAIEVAKKVNRKLIIAGNIPSGKQHEAYFETQIKPYINDKQIVFAGPVNDEQKNELLGKAYAFLMPILWNEPFGIVMAEAMACGTPVVGFARGAVPEVVENGNTGFAVETMDELITGVNQVKIIDRAKCREKAENSFDVKVVAKEYLNLYNNKY